MIRQMMKIGLVIFLLSVAATAQAEQQSDKERLAQIEKKKKMVKIAKEELNNTVWKVELRKTGGSNKKKKIINETLRFIDNRFESERLLSEGFSPTNFTVRIKRDTIVIWETMQTSEDKGIAFWRGEIREEGLMRGVLSRHLNNKAKTVEDYVFVSVGKDAITIAQEPAEEAPEEPKEMPIEVKEEVAERAPIESKIEKAKESTEASKATKETKEEPKKKEKKKRWWF